jgi:lipoyl synthase
MKQPEQSKGVTRASRWLGALESIEALEDAVFDAALVRACELESAGVSPRPLRVSTPTFKAYETAEAQGCSKMSFPAFSITAGGCALMCDHCQAKILEPMIPAVSPEMLERKVRELIALQDLRGFLLSGGSNPRNEVRYERFLPTVERLKREFPYLRIAVHSALMDKRRARMLEAAGVDTAMMDVIGADETIRDVYHLERPVADFEATLAALCATRMEIVPHIVIGLHYGRTLGEERALEIVARHAIHALVLVVVMPFYAKPGTFATPDPAEVGRVFLAARRTLHDREVLLGCARPAGMHKRVTDAYAVMAGLDGIAFPAEGALALAREIGRPTHQQHACCSIKLGTRSGESPATGVLTFQRNAGTTLPSACARGVAADAPIAKDGAGA